MPVVSRIILAVEALLVLAMIVRDPEQAHRPPPLRDFSEIAQNIDLVSTTV